MAVAVAVAGMVVETAAARAVETETAAATAVETETVVDMVVGMVVATAVAPPVMVAGMASPEQAGPERDMGKVSDMDTREADRVTDTDTEKHRSTA